MKRGGGGKARKEKWQERKKGRRMEARGIVPWTQCIQTSSATQNVTLSIPVMLSALAGETFAWT